MKFLLALLLLTVSALAQSGWQAGAARAVITPTQSPTWMSGYAGRNKPAEGKAQELYAKALALKDGKGHGVVMITLDLIGTPRILRERLATRLQKERGLAHEALLLNSSHTHCGPEYRIQGQAGIFLEVGEPAAAEAYGTWLEEQLHQLACQALDALQPAELSYHHARCGFAMNRRLLVEDQYKILPNPDGPVNHEVPVLRITDAKGPIKALLFGYACHNTTLSFTQWCGDYAGYTQEYLEAEHPGAVALFMQGCGADQNPYPRGRLELAQYHGRALATAVGAALAGPPREVKGSLSVTLGDVDLPFAPQPDRAGFEARLNSPDKRLAEHARRMLSRLDKEGALPTSYPFPIQVVRLGNLTFVALGGETVVDYSFRLQRELAAQGIIWVAAYSNDVMGYIASRRVLQEGGYEAGDSMKMGNLPFPWAADIEERIMQKAHALVKQAGEK